MSIYTIPDFLRKLPFSYWVAAATLAVFVLYFWRGLRGALAIPMIPLNRAIHKVMLWIAEVALLGMVVLVTYTVTLRYVFNDGVGWAEEVPRLLVTLFAFLAMAMGVRDHLHIGVNIFYNLFPKNGLMRRFMLFLGDYVVMLCGLFMLYYGWNRCAQMFRLPGKLPMTGLNTWWQYLPIPMAGFVIVYDSIMFLSGMVKPDDLLYSEPEKDFQEEYKEQQKLKEEAASQVWITQERKG